MTFFKTGFYILSFASNISVVLSLFTLSFEYVVAETISYLNKCALYFSIRCQDHAHIHLQSWDLINYHYHHFPFTCNLYGKWFWYIGNALDFRPRGPWLRVRASPTIKFLFRWSVENRPPIVFVRIFYYLLLFFIFIYFLHFFVPRITQVLFSQFHSILSH